MSAAVVKAPAPNHAATVMSRVARTTQAFTQWAMCTVVVAVMWAVFKHPVCAVFTRVSVLALAFVVYTATDVVAHVVPTATIIGQGSRDCFMELILTSISFVSGFADTRAVFRAYSVGATVDGTSNGTVIASIIPMALASARRHTLAIARAILGAWGERSRCWTGTMMATLIVLHTQSIRLTPRVPTICHAAMSISIRSSSPRCANGNARWPGWSRCRGSNAFIVEERGP